MKESFPDKLRAIADYLESDGVRVMDGSTIEFSSFDEEKHLDGMYNGHYPTGGQSLIIRLSIDNKTLRSSAINQYLKDLSDAI